MGKLVPPGSKVAVIAGMLRAEDHRKKADAFVETFPQHCAGGKIIKVIEGHEDEDESFQKTFDLLRRVPNLAGIYVNTVNCLPVCRALGARGLAGKVKLIATDPLCGNVAVPSKKEQSRLRSISSLIVKAGGGAADGGSSLQQDAIPAKGSLQSRCVMASNLHLFREMRLAESPAGNTAVDDRPSELTIF